MRRRILSTLLFLVLTGFAAGEDFFNDEFFGTIKNPEGAAFSVEWVEKFKESFQYMYDNSGISPLTFRLMTEALSESIFPQDPEIAARSFYNILEEADQDLRTGDSPQTVRSSALNEWQKTIGPLGEGAYEKREKFRKKIEKNAGNQGRTFGPVRNIRQSVSQSQGFSENNPGDISSPGPGTDSSQQRKGN